MVKTRIISIVLLLTVLLSQLMLVACDDGEKETGSEQSAVSEISATESTTALEQETAPAPEIAQKNYNDTLYMTIQTDNWFDLMWVEESKGDAMSQAVYERQLKIKDHLGVDIIGTNVANGYIDPFKTAVRNKDGSVDVLLPNPYLGVAGLISEGYLQDLRNFSELDLDADYWNREYMENLTVSDAIYLGYSNYNLAKAHMILFNKEMMAKYGDSLGESIYDTVRGYRWTLDKMLSLTSEVYIDNTADGKTADDTFGITGNQWIPFLVFATSSNIKYVEPNEKGELKVSIYNDLNKAKTTTLVEKLTALAAADSSWFWFKNEGTTQIHLYEGNTLMELVPTYRVVTYLNYDVDYGILPYPMLDETQKDVGYLSLNWDGYICMPAYIEAPEMAAETVELLSYYSDDVRKTFYEKILGKQASDAPDDSQMLDLVWGGIVSDIGLTYTSIGTSLGDLLYMLPEVSYVNSTLNVASYISSCESAANKALAKYIKTLKANGH
ncbi:MAG: hypothetical protein IJY39_01770 [Clostridia bacterium]|nr:hypothetical protein [Clostridia bacterium]